MHSFTATTHFKSSRFFVSLCIRFSDEFVGPIRTPYITRQYYSCPPTCSTFIYSVKCLRSTDSRSDDAPSTLPHYHSSTNIYVTTDNYSCLANAYAFFVVNSLSSSQFNYLPLLLQYPAIYTQVYQRYSLSRNFFHPPITLSPSLNVPPPPNKTQAAHTNRPTKHNVTSLYTDFLRGLLCHDVMQTDRPTPIPEATQPVSIQRSLKKQATCPSETSAPVQQDARRHEKAANNTNYLRLQTPTPTAMQPCS